MGLDLQKWNPFRFIRGSGEARAPGRDGGSGASPPEGSRAEASEATRLLQSLDPFGLLPGMFRGPFGGVAGVGHWFGDFAPNLFQPRIDIVDEGSALRLTAELPGMDRQDLEVIAEDGFLVLRGEKRIDKTQEEKGCYRLERAFGNFQRIVPLPDGIDLEHAEARFDTGILTLRLPKKVAEGSGTSRKLEIK
jgi:HSP20 family protein